MTKTERTAATVVLVLLVIFGIVVGIYQFNLCYPVVSDSVWYCLKHSF